MCNGCYLAEYHDREKKSECQCCSQGDLRVLVRRKDIDDETWLTLCANCAQIRGKRKLTLDQLKTELMPLGDRRTGDRRKVRRRMFERRSGKDRRFWEREEIEERRKMDRRIS